MNYSFSLKCKTALRCSEMHKRERLWFRGMYEDSGEEELFLEISFTPDTNYSFPLWVFFMAKLVKHEEITVFINSLILHPQQLHQLDDLLGHRGQGTRVSGSGHYVTAIIDGSPSKTEIAKE